MWIEYAYGVAGLFEVVGVLWVVWDFWRDRQRAGRFASRRKGLPPGRHGRAIIQDDIENDAVRRDPTSPQSQLILKRRRHDARSEVERGRRRIAGMEAEIVDMLRGNLFRALRGPGCLVIGIVLGTVANIANTH